MKNAIVIGSGVAGLSSAIRLAHKGYKVRIIEKNNYPGGKLSQIEMNGFRFDAGPSLFTLPEELLDVLNLGSSLPFEYIEHPVSCNYFWNDGSFFSAPSNTSSFIEKASSYFNVPSDAIQSYLEKAKYKYETTKPVFLEKNLHKLKSYFSIPFLRSYPKLPFLNINTTLHAYNKTKLLNDKLIQIMDRMATFNGSSPYQTSAVMSLISHLEFNQATYFPKEGMHQITDALVAKCQQLGVSINYNEAVTQFNKESNIIQEIETTKGKYKADIVVNNVDVYTTYSKFLGERIDKLQERSSSGVVFYWGMNHLFPELDLHNIFFSQDYQEEFESIFQNRKQLNDPTIYIHRSCEVVKSDAPKGKENWFVMINVPADTKLVNSQYIEELRLVVIKKLSKCLHKDISQFIECEETLSPILLQEKTGAYQGAIYGASSNSKMAAFLRHPNHSKYKNLYFVGGTVHPGGGIPLCLMSAKIATSEL